MLSFSISQFCADSPNPFTLNCFDLHWNIIIISIKSFYARGIGFAFKDNTVSGFPKHVQNNKFIITLTHPIDALLLCELVQFMHSTYAARRLVVRNVNIIIVLLQAEEFILVLLALIIGASHRT